MTSRDFSGSVIPSIDSTHNSSNSSPTKQEIQTSFHASISDSINEIKDKIKNIKSRIEEKGKESPNHHSKKSQNSSFDYSKIRKTTNFTNSHQKLDKTFNSGNSKLTETIIHKAQQSIRKSYQLSLKNRFEDSDKSDTPNTSNTPGTPLENNTPDSFNAKTSFGKVNKLFIKPTTTKNDLNSKSFAFLDNIPDKHRKNSDNQAMTMNKSWVGKTSEVIKDRENILPTYLKEFSRRRSQDGFLYGRLLGKGKFGEVFLAQHVETGFLVAIKKVSKAKLQEYKMVSRFIQEIKLHSMLDHPNIVKFYGFFEEKDNICLVLEYLNGGTLFDYMNQVGTLSLKEAIGFLKEVIQALTYVHQKEICHRDIKPQNIVISSYTGLAKLCDFGWSTLTQTPRQTFCGTLDYASPQIIERRPYNQSVDVWCIGVLTYEMFVGRAPFQNADRSAVMNAILNVDKTGIPYIDNLPPEAKEFIEDLLVKDPTKRPKMFELLLYPLFQMDHNTSKRKNK